MRMGTSAGAHIAGAVGPMAEVSITDRPVTAQGLAARRLTTAGGTTRMVQDASYFVGVLRQKINEVSGEIARMRADTERLTKEASVMGQFERKYETVMKEVRSLEGDLADYNLAMDKARTSMVRATTCGIDALMAPREHRPHQLHVRAPTSSPAAAGCLGDRWVSHSSATPQRGDVEGGGQRLY